MKIFLDDIDYRKFLFILSDVLDLYDVECWDYCVMPNHFHLTLRNRLPNLPKAMQHLNGEYATWWNGRHQGVGHVFQGRYKDQIVQRQGYLATLFQYLARNPLRANLVSAPEEWPWSAYRCIAGLAPNPGFLSSELVLAEFGGESPRVLRERYIARVLATWDDEDRIVKLLRSRRRVVGDAWFKRFVLEETAPAPAVPAGVESYVGYL
jgi:REP element-mobilizing transposase RayT